MAPVFSMLVRSAVIASCLAAVLAQRSEQMGKTTSQTNRARTKNQGTPAPHETRTNVIVTMRASTHAVVDNVHSLKYDNRTHRVQRVRDHLHEHAKQSQKTVFDVLNNSDATFTRSESFWLTNQIYVHGATPELIKKLKELPDVLDVEPESVFPLQQPVLATLGVSDIATSNEWGINKIKAQSVWATGNIGTGIVVGSIDTGVRGTHEALAKNFRKTYSWYDPELKSKTPYDSTGHGTHVMGIIVGSNGIGVAPGATWIACKGCRANGCYASDLLACFQFMLCPTTTDGLTKDCSKAPNIVNNSWGGGQGLTLFDTVIKAWRAAGIIPVAAAGNIGTQCKTIETPGDNVNMITVGSTDASDAISSFSAKGPAVNGLRKPDLMAPGNLIRSTCWGSDSDYCTKSGTSMAAPHVTGAIILYMKAKPGATYDQIKNAFQGTAITSTLKSTGVTCGGIADNFFPNNHYGYGRIDVVKALAK